MLHWVYWLHWLYWVYFWVFVSDGPLRRSELPAPELPQAGAKSAEKELFAACEQMWLTGQRREGW